MGCSSYPSVFGSTLSVINSVALATEVFLKAERTVEDFWLIALPSESLFLAYWVGLRMYAYYTWKRKEIRHELMRIAQCCRRRVQSPASSRHDQVSETERDLGWGGTSSIWAVTGSLKIPNKPQNQPGS
ncbi:hypothetical protein COCON_G00171580 [Conger conger]|uniref:Uncharacterized protein n=1 Tax=Conger conger TaxID=82655 RepID=A0A9Q1D8M5_CONCO|nr:hypothetical protein COCON_G00171580 [Conger conger]